MPFLRILVHKAKKRKAKKSTANLLLKRFPRNRGNWKDGRRPEEGGMKEREEGQDCNFCGQVVGVVEKFA